MGSPPPTGPPPLRIEVRDPALVRQAVLDEFTRLDVSMEFNSVGRWELEVPASCSCLDMLTTPGHGILLLREDTNEVWFSGPIEEVVERFDVEGSVYTIRGRDDNGLLADRLALPNPLQEVYVEAVLQDAPAAYWRMNDTLTAVGQQTTDWSGHLRHMICPATPNFPTSGRAGALQTQRDPAYLFSGGLQYIYRNHDATLEFTTGQSITVEAWASVTDYPSSGRIILAKGSNTNLNHQFFIQAGGTFQFGYSSGNGTLQHRFASAMVIPTGVWHHLAATYTYGMAASAHLYVNGKEVSGSWVTGTGTAAPDLVPTLATYIGTRSGGDTYFNGTIDEVAIYPTALSATRIAAHYYAGVREESYIGAVITDQPVRYYRLGEASGANTFDYSGNVVTAAFSATGMILGQTGVVLDGDHAPYFDGLSGFVQAPVLPTLPQFTVEAWVKPDSVVTTGGTSIVSDAYIGGAINFALIFSDATSVKAGIYVAGWHETAPTPVPNGEWTYLAMTYDGALLRLFKNGVLVQTHAWAGAPASGGSHIRIGRRWDGSNDYFKGQIDEVAIYPTPLSPTRIAAHYDAQIAGYDVRSGTVEAVMRGFVDANAGPSAVANRRIPHFALGTYNGLGAEITEQARYANLLDLLRLLAVKGEDGSNLIRNPGFETDTVGYGGYLAAIDRVIQTARFGIASCRVSTTDAGFSGVYFIGRAWAAHPIPVLPGVQYTFGLYARLATLSSKNMVLTIEWWTAADAAISNSNRSVTLDSTDWQRFSMTAIAPPTAAYVTLTFYVSAVAQGVFDYYTDGWQFLVGSDYQDLTPLGFHLRHDIVTSRLVFDVYWPRDQRPEVIYSPTLQNIYGYEHVLPAPKANVVYLGGKGVLTGRVVAVAADNESVAAWGRREVFADRRDAVDPLILAQSANQELADHASRETIEVQPMVIEGLLFGDDYQLGDRVSVLTRTGHAIEQVVYAVDIQISEEGVLINPHIGAPTVLDPDSSRSTLEAIDERINRLEAT